MKVYTCHTARPGLFSRAIRWATDEGVSHSLLLLYSDELQSWLAAEALGDRGVVLRPASRSEALPHAVRAFRLAASEPLAKEIARQVVGSVGSGYDWRQTVLWLFAGIGNRMAKRDRWVPRYESPGRLNCSETISRALIAIGMPGEWHPLAHPGMLCREQARSSWWEPVSVRWLLEQAIPYRFSGWLPGETPAPFPPSRRGGAA